MIKINRVNSAITAQQNFIFNNFRILRLGFGFKIRLAWAYRGLTI